MNLERSERVVIPVLPLRDVVVYPHMVIPLFVGREKSIRCLEAAMEQEKRILLVAQKEAATDEPAFDDLYRVWSARITARRSLRPGLTPGGTVETTGDPIKRMRRRNEPPPVGRGL